ncbi:hypothetical protein DNL40_08700 [Xylanimonas oleitrophica]|uniref:Uncharacterized protein n=1 Tax=Xylanimonas oleitrophica TaxID=2607479 RepID=A0A2W5WNY7_9MICO|nr:hypothetical protein [Xylanimonas oleitrophica]PZR53077.1 hypothetical protein DNL40_08700 [Xylanimonas oleitrophica]
MSTLTTTRSTASAAAVRDVRPVSFLTLTLVEWRKQLDTRAGRWLLVVIGIITAAVLTIMAIVNGGNHSFQAFLLGTSTPMSMLLPIVGVLAATSEWSQRTALVTFTLEPRRMRVGLAKLVSALASAVVFFAAAVVLAALAHLAVVLFRDVDPAWSLDLGVVGGMLLLAVLGMAQGIGFGLLLLNTPLAIVSLLLLPAVFSLVVMLIPAVQDALPWIDLGTSGQVLLMGQPVDGEGWAQLATSSLIWVVAPLVGGLFRVATREVKSA